VNAKLDKELKASIDILKALRPKPLNVELDLELAQEIMSELEGMFLKTPTRIFLIRLKSGIQGAVNSRKEKEKEIMYKIEQLNEFSKEAVACSIAFQRMGFDMTNVAAGVDSEGKAFVTLHHGGEQYNVVLGKLIDISANIYVAKWREAILNLLENQITDVSIAELLIRDPSSISDSKSKR